MTVDFLSYCRFHLRRVVQHQPVWLLGVALAGIGLLLVIADYVSASREVAAGKEQLVQLSARARKIVSVPVQDSSAQRQPPVLPWFLSAQLVDQFSRIAEGSKLPLDEVAYSLEEGGNQPYLRYRVTTTVVASYPVIRHFVDDISTTMPNVDLDSIHCTRSDITAAVLSCELAFSAFFRRDGHG